MRNFKKGFTLIELLVVIAVVGVLAAGSVILLNPKTQFDKAHDAQRRSDLKQIQNVLEVYYNDRKSYPTTLPTWGTQWAEGGATYMGTLPSDPSSPSRNYFYCSDGKYYSIYASLQVGAGSIANFSTNCPSGNSATSCGTGGACNYGVTSSDRDP